MGRRELIDAQFGKRVREERERRRWSQEDLATRLTEKGIPTYPSTIAKIEATRKPRAVRLGEAIGIADLFEVALDALLGRQGPDDSTLTFALSVLGDYAGDAQRQIQHAQQVASDIDDQLESVEESFDVPGIDDLRQVAQNIDAALQTAQSSASTLAALVSASIVETTQ